MTPTSILRKTGLIMAIVLVASACSGGAGEPPAVTDSISTGIEVPGDPIPLTPFETFAGETITLATYTGRPLVVNFWASWCPSCVAEMSAAFLPAQLELGESVAFLGINIADERDKALELVAETGVLFDLAEDVSGQLYIELGGLGMPLTVFVSEDGQIREVHNGPLTEQQLLDRVNGVLLS